MTALPFWMVVLQKRFPIRLQPVPRAPIDLRKAHDALRRQETGSRRTRLDSGPFQTLFEGVGTGIRGLGTISKASDSNLKPSN